MRNLKDAAETYRVRVETTYPRDGYWGPAGTVHTSYLGPYATLGAAKGIRTRETRNHDWRRTVCTIERAETTWTEIHE